MSTPTEQAPFPHDRPRSERMARQLAERALLIALMAELLRRLDLGDGVADVVADAPRGTLTYTHDMRRFLVALTVVTEQ